MKIESLISKIAKLSDCIVYERTGAPRVLSKHRVPEDLDMFYEKCGGITLYQNADYPITIVPAERVAIANPIIRGELYNSVCFDEINDDDISLSWYIIADDHNGDFLTIDLSIERLGRCYPSFWDVHAIPGDSPIIANSFTELLEKLIENKGEHWYWLRPSFVSFGDAYD